ncbi:hypothetical protein WMW72_22165 [Paenibacillus filicis]|uniref:Uncharacterized protein n=1 Tax=Paenibacillus filicis TaxID=669464 RepID=A0ABU9DP17_9BACL
MEPEQKKNREITYQVGWKRGKITLAKPDHASIPDLPQTSDSSERAIQESPLQAWNRMVLWRKAPVPGNAVVLTVCLFALPAVLFTLFVWAVYELSRLS